MNRDYQKPGPKPKHGPNPTTLKVSPELKPLLAQVRDALYQGDIEGAIALLRQHK